MLLQNIIFQVIGECGGLDSYYQISNEMSNNIKSRSKDKIPLYAKILTIYAVAETIDSTFFRKLVNYWRISYQGIRCDFSVHLQDLLWKLDMLNKIMNNTSKRESRTIFYIDMYVSQNFTFLFWLT